MALRKLCPCCGGFEQDNKREKLLMATVIKMKFNYYYYILVVALAATRCRDGTRAAALHSSSGAIE